MWAIYGGQKKLMILVEKQCVNEQLMKVSLSSYLQ
jgi:hypothetical protein